MSHNIYAIHPNEELKINVLGKRFTFLSCNGEEYYKDTGGKFKYGFPYPPFQMESVVNISGQVGAFIVDDRDIVWVYDGKKYFVRPRMGVALTYVEMYDNASLDDVKDILGVV